MLAGIHRKIHVGLVFISALPCAVYAHTCNQATDMECGVVKLRIADYVHQGLTRLGRADGMLVPFPGDAKLRFVVTTTCRHSLRGRLVLAPGCDCTKENG